MSLHIHDTSWKFQSHKIEFNNLVGGWLPFLKLCVFLAIVRIRIDIIDETFGPWTLCVSRIYRVLSLLFRLNWEVIVLDLLLLGCKAWWELPSCVISLDFLKFVGRRRGKVRRTREWSPVFDLCHIRKTGICEWKPHEGQSQVGTGRDCWTLTETRMARPFLEVTFSALVGTVDSPGSPLPQKSLCTWSEVQPRWDASSVKQKLQD